MNRRVKSMVAGVAVAAAALGAAQWLEAKGPWLKKAQEAGFADAKDCGYCHLKPKGGKELSDRGQWLVAQKKEKKAEAVDVAWLKDYKAPETKK